MPTFERVAVRIAFALYLSALLIWLMLGLLPMHGTRAGMAQMDLDETTPLQTAVEYFFSVLNLVLGVLLFARRPDDRVPRLLAFALLGTAATFNLPSHRVFHLIGSPWPIATVHFTFHIVSGVAYMWAVVLFPDGTAPRGIRLPAWAVRTLVVVTTTLVAVVCWRSSFLSHPQFFVVFFGIAVALLGVGAQVLRILDPRTTAANRATARLLCAALLPALVVALVWLCARTAALAGPATQAATVGLGIQQLFPAVFAIVPVVLFTAVVRYRLWDIDRLLSRVLVYGLVAVALSAAYVLAVAVGARLAHGSLWVTALALSVAAVLVEPLRTAGRTWANKVVFGQVLSPAEAVRELADALEHLTPATELDHVVAVTVAATRADAAELWLIDGDRLRCAAATHPPPPEIVDAATEPDTAQLVTLVGADRGWPLRHQGDLLGLLAVHAPPGEHLGPADDTAGNEIAAHAGLLVHNAVLTAGLARRVDALAAQARALTDSRRRLVAAQDTERHTLERALHDGAQQALVAAIIGARAGADAGVLSGGARQQLREVLRTAQRDIRELSGDGRPGPLRRLGLVGALHRAAQLAGRSGVQVDARVELRPPHDRLPPEVETAVYFACVEGLQNVAKYAHARRALISVETRADGVSFTVTDDGVGASLPRGRHAGSGLSALSERLTALGGDVTVEADAHGGVQLRGWVPVRPVRGVPA